SRAMANFRLGENQKALEDLQVVIAKNPTAAAQQYKVITLARLGNKQDAKSDLDRFEKSDAPEHSKLSLAAIAAAELGEGADKAFDALEAAMGKHPQDAGLRYEAARAFSLASRAGGGRRMTGGGQFEPTTHHVPPTTLESRCLQLLREAVNND